MRKIDKLWAMWKVNNWLYRHHLSILAQLGRFLIRVICSADIPPQMIIGKGTKFPHMALGSLFHPKVIIGNNCVILHGVTIGEKAGHDGLPQIGNNCWIGTHAVILGDITIGDNSIIGASSVVVKDIPDNCVVAGNPAKIIRQLPPPFKSLIIKTIPIYYKTKARLMKII